MKTAFIAIALFLILSPTSAMTLSKLSIQDESAKQIGGDEKLCPVCVSFLSQAIDQLLNIILNAGVIGGCGDLCSKLPQKIEATVCDLLCDYVGIKEFIALIEKADIDPIYMCEELKVCPILDGGAANITEFAVSPKQGQQGATFDFALEFQVTKPTGTGEIAISVVPPPPGMPFGDATLNEGLKVGNYRSGFQLQAKPSEDEPFNPGQYKVDVAICYGECGSKHPHSAVLSTAQAVFEITQ